MPKSTAPSISRASEVKLSLIPAGPYIDMIWPHVAPFLLRSYRHRDQDIPVSLRGELRNGKRQLWVISMGDVTILAAGVTSIYAMRSGLALKIEHLGGGSMWEWQHLLKEMEAYARSQGCKKLIWEGRKGWVRLFPDYQVLAVTMIKRLDNG